MKKLEILKSEIDETLKYKFITDDNYIIEACVLFFWDEKATVNICVSSQVGCMSNCSFCITGKKRFVRNLKKEEIIEQVKLVFSNAPQLENEFFEITYMGTGEPLYNIDEVLGSIKFFEDNYDKLQRINVSTIMPNTDRVFKNNFQTTYPLHFQYSLHFLTDELRGKYFGTKLIPIIESIQYLDDLSKSNGERFCVNYILFKGINDSITDAKKLVELLADKNAYVKISKYTPVSCNKILEPSNNTKNFTKILDEANVIWKTFESKGDDIKASCGHLLSDVDF